MSQPSVAEIIQRAKDLAPVMAERAQECEKLGRLPDSSFADFRDAGFFRISQPKIHGGYEMDLRVMYEVSRELARGGCASSAWVMSILAIHNFYLGYFPPTAQEYIWGDDQDAQTCTPFNPAGTVKKVAGGIELSNGRWPFASGTDHAKYALVGVLIESAEGSPPDFCQCVVPRGDFAIDHDSWNVAGLKGTGSKDITIEGCFIPYSRICNLTQVIQGNAPGREVNTGALYKQDFFAPSACTLVAPAAGAAQCMLDQFAEKLGSRVLVFGAGNQVEKTPSLIRLVEAESEIDAGDLLLEKDSELHKQLALTGGTPSREQRAHSWYLNAYATTLFTRAADRLYAASGGSALQSSSPLQRSWRDIHAINNHGGLNFDSNAEVYAKVKLGLPVDSPLVG